MADFKNIEYLKKGNKRQRKAHDFLNDSGILELLRDYSPILTGSIPIGIDLPESDLDIICECQDHDIFRNNLKLYFGNYKTFKLWENSFYGVKAIIASFNSNNFKIEIFGQNIPTCQQNAYKHMLIENQILLEKGLGFRNQIIALKAKGLKTEQAFAELLDIKGDPYIELLKFHTKF